MTREPLTRRQMLARGGALTGGAAALGLAGLGGYALRGGPAPDTDDHAHTVTPARQAAAAQVWRFVSRPDLAPPAVTVTSAGGLGGPACVFLSPKPYPLGSTAPGQHGNMILDRAGELIWFQPSNPHGWLDLNVQSYQGKPVLTWWSGHENIDYGDGVGIIADTSYRTIATIRAGNGLMADAHELVLTPRGTALITAFRMSPAHLPAYHGHKEDLLLSGVAQEIDIATGKVVFEWDSLGHVALSEVVGHPYLPVSHHRRAFDYFHINSLALAPDGDLLVSARNTCAVYKVSRASGAVVWRLGGLRSSFAMGPGATFWFQHTVRPLGATGLSVFDDGGGLPRKEPQARALLLDLDTSAMRATVRRSYTHPAHLASENQGSVQVLPDGRVFVGWGNQPYFSEFSEAGALLLDGQFPAGVSSYRAFTGDWSATPDAPPDIAAVHSPAGGTLVYASWNGATGVAGWTVRAGPSPASLTDVATQPRTGFETMITVATRGPYFAVVPHDAAGRPLRSSATIRSSYRPLR